jgi:mannosyltransferase OCH1-like enzyme
MAYFLWWDDGCDELLSQAQPGLVDTINALPLVVEKYDIFRIVALNEFGGIVGYKRLKETSRLY